MQCPGLLFVIDGATRFLEGVQCHESFRAKSHFGTFPGQKKCVAAKRREGQGFRDEREGYRLLPFTSIEGLPNRAAFCPRPAIRH